LNNPGTLDPTILKMLKAHHLYNSCRRKKSQTREGSREKEKKRDIKRKE